MSGTFDLRFMAKKAGCEPGGLKKMINKYLNANLDDSHDYKFHSHWEDPTLDHAHVYYAAQDVLKAVELFLFFGQKLENEGFFEGKSAHIQRIINNHCLQYLDIKFSAVGTNRQMQEDDQLQLQQEQSSGNGMGLLTTALAAGGAAFLGYMVYNAQRRNNNN